MPDATQSNNTSQPPVRGSEDAQSHVVSEFHDVPEVADPPSRSTPEERKRTAFYRMVCGAVALGLWLILFSGGLLIETIEYRVVLAPHAFPGHHEKDLAAKIEATPYQGSYFYAFAMSSLFFTPTT